MREPDGWHVRRGFRYRSDKKYNNNARIQIRIRGELLLLLLLDSVLHCDSLTLTYEPYVHARGDRPNVTVLRVSLVSPYGQARRTEKGTECELMGIIAVRSRGNSKCVCACV